MRKKKNNRWIGIVLIVVLIVVLILLIAFSKGPKDYTRLSLTEKRWIENNKKEVINVSIANNIPVFSEDGEGVFFDYVDTLEDSTGLSFNMISYNASSDVVKNDLYYEVIKQENYNKIKKDDLIFYKDYYVLVGKIDDKIVRTDSIKDKRIGVLSEDLANVSYFISSENGVTYTPYENSTDLLNSIKNDNVDYIAVPKLRYLSSIIENKYHIIYNMTEVKEAYILKISDDASNELSNIVRKSFVTYEKNNLKNKYNQYLINFLMNANNISEKAKADFLGKKYVFGYLENEPYTNTINNKLIGLDSTYLDMFSTMSGATFSIKKYHSVKDLTEELNNGKVDIAPNYYNYSNLKGNYEKTISPYEEQYVILTNKNNTNVVVNSVKSLKNKKVLTTNSTLAKFLEKEGKAKVKTYDKLSSLINSINEDSIIALDRNVYDIYKETDFLDYRVIFNDKENLEYGYIIKDSNENATLKILFPRYMEMINYKEIYNIAWKDYGVDSKQISYAFLYFVAAILVLFIIWLLIRKKVKAKKKNKREETIRYIDPLTSLKNRNYLNKNFKKWEDNIIYPQTVIVINLNNLRHINDVYGHEEGDKLIKLAANVLIRNQLEQSDIIRTDGNEYLIYMVGYEKSKVVSYMRKLYKELSELPYGYGATLGYSMIEDDIKTIDDAINEAVLEIRASKEMNSKGK